MESNENDQLNVLNELEMLKKKIENEPQLGGKTKSKSKLKYDKIVEGFSDMLHIDPDGEKAKKKVHSHGNCGV